VEGGIPPRIYDPQYRQLTRVLLGRPDAGADEPDPYERPKLPIESPSIVPDQQPPLPQADTDGGNSGGRDGKIGSGGNDREWQRDCNEAWQDEKYVYCPQFRPIDPVYERTCQARATQRLRECFQRMPQRDKFSTKEIPYEDLKKFLDRQRAEEKKRKAKSKKRK
jgi:hypothetical protein